MSISSTPEVLCGAVDITAEPNIAIPEASALRTVIEMVVWSEDAFTATDVHGGVATCMAGSQHQFKFNEDVSVDPADPDYLLVTKVTFQGTAPLHYILHGVARGAAQ